MRRGGRSRGSCSPCSSASSRSCSSASAGCRWPRRRSTSGAPRAPARCRQRRTWPRARCCGRRWSRRRGPRAPTRPRPIADGVQSLSGRVVRGGRRRRRAWSSPTRATPPGWARGSTWPPGRRWATARGRAGRAVVAQVPVLGETGPQTGQVVGMVAVGQTYPSLGESLLSAVPNLLTYLGLAGIVGFAGSLLVARRVKRQTLGLEPVEIRGLVEHREAMLTGIKEGVIGLDLDDRVTLVNDEAHLMLGLPAECVGRSLHRAGHRGPPARRAHRRGDAAGRRRVRRRADPHAQPQAGRRARARPSARSRPCATSPSCASSKQELGVTRQTTEALRAQAHEFANRLHTISGLLELGEYEEVLRYVKRLGSATQDLAAAVTERVDSPPLAALLIAKSSVAAERGVQLRIAPRDAGSGRSTRIWPRTSPRSSATSSTTPWTRWARSAAGRSTGRVRAGATARCAVRGPRLGARGGPRAGRGGVHQRLHHEGGRRRATAGSGSR